MLTYLAPSASLAFSAVKLSLALATDSMEDLAGAKAVGKVFTAEDAEEERVSPVYLGDRTVEMTGACMSALVWGWHLILEMHSRNGFIPCRPRR